MKAGISQSTQLKQEIKINPRLYQAMDLLYMPLLDLQQHLKQELMNNPFLEMVEPEEEEDEEEGQTEEAPEQEKATDEIDWERYLENHAMQAPLPSFRATGDSDSWGGISR